MQKLFLQVFLLMTFFLSGCSTDTLVEKVSGKTGVYSIGTTNYAFNISDDATIYGEDEGFSLVFKSWGNNSLKYQGLDEDGYIITVELIDLTYWGGTYTRKKMDDIEMIIGFSWAKQI